MKKEHEDFSVNLTAHDITEIFAIEKLIAAFKYVVKKGYNGPTEKHDCWEILFVKKGKIIRKSGDNTYYLNDNELVFDTPNELHSITNTLEDCQFYCISFKTRSTLINSFSNNIFKTNAKEGSIIENIKKEIDKFLVNCSPDEELKGMKRREKSSDITAEQMSKILIESLLISLYRNSIFIHKEHRTHELVIRKKEIDDYLKSNLQNNLTLKDVARNFNMSVSSFKRYFASVHTSGIIEYYSNLKIAEAKNLLTNTNMSIQMISDHLCFSTIHYFSSLFKKKTGQSPSTYRKYHYAYKDNNY